MTSADPDGAEGDGHRVVPHAAHWGYFDAVVSGGRVVEARPFARDPAPPALLAGVPDLVHSAARVDRPYARRGWLRGERAGSTRGDDPFVPLSWDAAIRLVAEEERRVRAEGGGRGAAILGGSYGWASAGRFHHARSQLHRHLALGGGFTGQATNYSYGAGMTLMPRVLGTNAVIQGPTTDWAAIAAHARLMLCFGGLPAKNGVVTAGGAGAHEYGALAAAAARAGVRLVNLSPCRGDAEAALGAEWVPVRPGGDAALVLAMLQLLVAEGLEDRAFLARATVGWDRLRAYLMGESGDGTPKTPAWAAPLCDVPEATIARLAREAARAPTMLTATWSLQRAEHGEQPWWALVALAAALGAMGKPGQGVAFGYGSINGMGTPRRPLPSVDMPVPPNPGLSIPVARLADLLENPGGAIPYDGGTVGPLPRVRLVWWAGGNPFHHHQDLNRLRRAWSRAETVVVHEALWTAVARQADLVLPATTTLERDDIASSGRDRFVRAMRAAVRPVGLARDDHAILADLADAAGHGAAFSEGRGVPAWLRHLYETWRGRAARLGHAVPDFDAFWAAGHVEVAPPEEPHTAFADFARDPAAHPLATPSGRVELWSEAVARSGLPGHPAWLEPTEWLGAAAAADRFPLHLLTPQPATRLHGQLDPARASLASKVEGREPIRLNPDDAAARGLREGQAVRVFNDRGACLAGLRLDDGLRRGVAAMATGAWWDPQVVGGEALCAHGNPNVLTRDRGTSPFGQGCSAQSCLVEVEAWRGPLPPVRVHAPPEVVASAW